MGTKNISRSAKGPLAEEAKSLQVEIYTTEAKDVLPPMAEGLVEKEMKQEYYKISLLGMSTGSSCD